MLTKTQTDEYWIGMLFVMNGYSATPVVHGAVLCSLVVQDGLGFVTRVILTTG